ncbi:hypothetical protein MB02_10495 [Croceicoccus estronivorus]|nr:hypothetical protein MB02_10495 [Croceicoccus estronivorus]
MWLRPARVERVQQWRILGWRESGQVAAARSGPVKRGLASPLTGSPAGVPITFMARAAFVKRKAAMAKSHMDQDRKYKVGLQPVRGREQSLWPRTFFCSQMGRQLSSVNGEGCLLKTVALQKVHSTEIFFHPLWRGGNFR